MIKTISKNRFKTLGKALDNVGINIEYQILSLMILTVFIAFYRFNKTPAKVFLGDVGSISCGFLVGFIMILMTASGEKGLQNQVMVITMKKLKQTMVRMKIINI